MLLIDPFLLAHVLFAGCLSIMLLPNGPVWPRSRGACSRVCHGAAVGRELWCVADAVPATAGPGVLECCRSLRVVPLAPRTSLLVAVCMYFHIIAADGEPKD